MFPLVIYFIIVSNDLIVINGHIQFFAFTTNKYILRMYLYCKLFTQATDRFMATNDFDSYMIEVCEIFFFKKVGS